MSDLEAVLWIANDGRVMKLEGDALEALNTPWPTDDELDALMPIDVPDEDMPVRNSDHSAAQSMTPAEIVSASRRLWHADAEVQIETLQRLIEACERLRWPSYEPGPEGFWY